MRAFLAAGGQTREGETQRMPSCSPRCWTGKDRMGLKAQSAAAIAARILAG